MKIRWTIGLCRILVLDSTKMEIRDSDNNKYMTVCWVYGAGLRDWEDWQLFSQIKSKASDKGDRKIF